MKQLLRSRHGTAAVEFALVAPVALLMIMGIVEFGYQMWLRVSLDYALAQTARCYALQYVDGGSNINCASVAGATTRFKTLAAGVPFSGGNLTLSSPGPGCLSYQYATTWLEPALMPVAAPTWKAQSCYDY